MATEVNNMMMDSMIESRQADHFFFLCRLDDFMTTPFTANRKNANDPSSDFPLLFANTRIPRVNSVSFRIFCGSCSFSKLGGTHRRTILASSHAVARDLHAPSVFLRSTANRTVSI